MTAPKSNLTIVYIVTKLELGGAQKVCLLLLNQLNNKKTQTFIISGTKGPLVNTVKNNPRSILLDTFEREISPKNFLKDIKTFIQITKQLSQLKKNHTNIIVHTHSTKAGILGRWAAFFAGIKQRVHTIHGYGFHPHQTFLQWTPIYFIELLTSFITTHFICVSYADQKTGIRLFPGFAKKNSVIRAAVDQKSFFIPAEKTKFYSENRPFIFGTISCFKPQKNLFDLLKAFELVHHKNPHTRLEIIGDGQLRNKIEQWITTHNLMHVITLHGWQSDVAPIMYHWHSFTLSSLWEGLPCVIIEARLLKLPVIAYNTGGISEVIIHNTNGLLCPQKEWQQLALNMLNLSQNKKLYKKLKDNPDTLIEFETNTMVEQHKQLYKKL